MTYREALVALVNEAERNNFIDNNGHQFVQSEVYADAKNLLDRDKPKPVPQTQRQALSVLLLMIEADGVHLVKTELFQAAKATLERDDEMTLEEVRQLLKIDDVRVDGVQAVVITAGRFRLMPIAAINSFTTPNYEDGGILPMGPNGSLVVGGDPDLPNGRPPSIKNLRKFLEG